MVVEEAFVLFIGDGFGEEVGGPGLLIGGELGEDVVGGGGRRGGG